LYEGGAYAERNPSWHEPDAPWKARHIEAMMRRNQVPAASICEVGCGTGEVLLNLASAFPDSQFSGYEISGYAFERAKRKERTSVKFHHGDILEAGALTFDVLILADVIEHVENYVGFLKQLRPLAKRTILHIPLDLSVQSVLRVQPILGQRESVGHIHYFTKDTALATLRDCGYTVVDYKYTASRLELPHQARSSKLMHLPRRLAYALNPDLAVRVLGGYSLLVLAK
jgi:SAM-dependent methyltransferase